MELKEKPFDFYECQVCLSSLLERKPRLLRCGHTFCQSCLEEIIYREHVVCPKCRTPTPATRVEKLPINIDIQRVRDREKELVLGPNAICRKCFLDVFTTRTAKWKCIDCSSNFCDECIHHHDSLVIFKSHCIEPLEIKVIKKGDVPLCASHGYELVFICLECCQAACKDCAIEMVHDSHTKRLTKFQQGVETVKENAAKLLKEIDSACRSYETFLAEHKIRKFSFEKIQERTQTGLSALKKVLNESNDYSFISGFSRIRKDVSSYLEWIERASSETGNDLLLGDAEVLFVPADASLIPLTQPRQVLSLRPGGSVQIHFPAELTTSDEGEGFYVDNDVAYVQRIDKRGFMVKQYHPHSHVRSQINDACVHGNYLYIGQRTGICAMPLDYQGEEDIRIYRPDTPRITTFRVYDETMFVVADHTVGRVVTYEPLLDKTTAVVHGLDDPQFLGIIRAVDGVKYTVTEFGGNGRIRIYNQNWELINTITGEGGYCSLGATLVTPSGSLLIADSENNRISEYTCSGQLMRHILTAENGVYRPSSLAFHHPWLWFTEVDYFDSNRMKVKLFNLAPSPEDLAGYQDELFNLAPLPADLYGDMDDPFNLAPSPVFIAGDVDELFNLAPSPGDLDGEPSPDDQASDVGEFSSDDQDGDTDGESNVDNQNT